MSRLGIFFADGCEEIEGLAVVDIVRRAKMDITTISVTGKKEVTGSHHITFETDALFEDVDFSIRFDRRKNYTDRRCLLLLFL